MVDRFRRTRRIAAVGAVLGMAAASIVGIAGEGGAAPEAPSQDSAMDSLVRLNEVQVIGSHNSYHLIPPPQEEQLRRQFIHDGADLMHYEHSPLGVQFASEKVRQIELDVFVDSAGGRYSQPLLRTATGSGAYHPEEMDAPGLKVLHVQDVDYASTCRTLASCLGEVKTWSDQNPTHMPIAILLELKDTPLEFGGLTFVDPEPFDAAAMDELDATIRSVFPADQMITPDDVRGSHPTLEEAVLAGDAWPTLAEGRGKVMFMMDNGGGYRTTYLAGHPSLQGRVLFTNANPGQPDAAFVKRNDALDPSIPGLVSAGYVVRTRADGDTVEARANDTSKRDAALASGAQWVSTDYQVPNIAVGFTTPYVAEIPGGTVARCNPINGPEGCVSSSIDTIYTPVERQPWQEETTTTSAPRPQDPGPSPDPGRPGVARAAEPRRASPAYTG